MTLQDKKAWLRRNGRIVVYRRVAGFEPSLRWVANNKGRHMKHVSSRVKGKDIDAVGRLYDRVKDDLYEMCV